MYGRWGAGFQYIRKSIQTQAWVLTKGEGIQLGEIDEGSTWLQFGGAVACSFFSFGANIRYIEQTLEISCHEIDPPQYLNKYDSAMGFDIGFLAEFGPIYERNSKKMFSAGFLLQDLNKPELLGQKYIVNFRPGFGYRPLYNLLFSMELYDAAQQYFDHPQIRIGSEWIFSTPFLTGDMALRTGLYHLNGADYRAFTGGFGYLRPVSHRFSLGIDYTFINWEKAKKVTHLLSLSCKF
jgi:hypothetical protein